MIDNPMGVNAGMSAASLLESPNITCECGSKLFIEAVVLKKLSALYSPTGKEQIYPIPVYVCSKCGKIPEELTSKANAKKILGEEVDDKKTSEEKDTKSSLIV